MELLAVITIIAILLALLTPALDQAVYQTELSVCGARQKAVASGVASYAVNHQRFYPDRAVIKPGVLRPRPFVLRDRDDPQPDDRPVLREALGTLDVLKDPFCPDIDLDTDIVASGWNPVIYANYCLWFGMYYTRAAGGGQGLRKLGDRLQWLETSRGRNVVRRFSVLASDWDQVLTDATNPVTINSHPDKLEVTYPNRQVGSGGILSWYLSLTTWERGPLDENFAMDDGSVRRINDVAWDDDRMARVPYQIDGRPYGQDLPTGLWLHLPAE